MDEELVDTLTTPWEDTKEVNNSSKTNPKEGDEFVPPFQWNVVKIDSPDTINETTSLAIAAKDSGSPAGVENAVICNRHVRVNFGASIEDFHKASMLAAEGGGSISVDMEEGVFNLKVGDEVSSESDEEEDEEEY